MGTKVYLRQKPISENRKTLYLDFYPSIENPKTGKKTRREFLKLYLFSEYEFKEQRYINEKGKEAKRFIPVFDKNGNPKKVALNQIDRLHNINVMQIAEQIRAKRHNQVNKPEVYTDYEKQQLKQKEKQETSFIEYYQTQAAKRKGSNSDSWSCSLHHLKDYAGGDILFKYIDESFCNGFRQHLFTTKSKRSDKTGISNNTAVSYFNKFKAVLRQAYKDEYLNKDLNAKIESIKEEPTQREFLTIEELNALVKAPCKNPVLKAAALFSALTGLRFGDIKKLTWGELQQSEGQDYIRFRQAKTEEYENLPISGQAVELLGERGEPGEPVFRGLKYSDGQNVLLADWIKAAGIIKKITFHNFRHTFATLQLGANTDIYTVSKLLGHKNVATTQIYTKVIDKLKIEAANKIKLDM